MGFEAVLVPEADRITPALVIEVKRQKLVLETVFGKRITVARDKILHAEPLDDAGLPDALSHLKRLASQAETLKQDVDLELLWETFVDQGDPACSLQELAAAYFSDAVDLARLKAMDLALGAPAAADFFRRAGARFRVQTRAQRARQLERQAEEEAQQARFRAALEQLAGVLRQGDDTGDLGKDAAAALEQLRTFVRHGSGPGEAVAEHLKPVLAEIDRSVGSSLREAGLAALIALDVWGRPSDLLVGKYRLKRTFQPAHQDAVEEVRAAVAARTDLPAARTSCAFTVDDEGTRDFDDALSLQEDTDGAWVLGVHIADPSPYIPVGSPLDDEAYGRGTTVYLPDGKYPMFPPALSEDLLSLRQGEPRPVLSFYFRFPEPDAEPDPPQLVKERLVVRHNLVYDEVDRMIQGEANGSPDPSAGDHDRGAVARSVRQVARLAGALRARREAAGALTFHRPELKIRVDEEGEVRLTVLDPGSPAHRMVSEMMILVNQSGAAYLRDRGIPAIYRAQNPPREPVQLGSDYDPVTFRQEVRKMVKARLSLDPEPHAGLGLACYTQLSSPLRRYADLVMHRQLSHVLEGRPAPYPDRDDLLEVVVTSDMNYQTAVKTERAARHAYTLRYLEARIHEVVPVIVVEPLAGRSDVLVELESTALVGRLRCGAGAAPPVGTRLEARLAAVDVFQEEFVLDPMA